MKLSRRHALLAAAAIALPAWAQDYPARTITLVVPFTAGGGVDAVARLLAEKLRASLKQPVVVDNKPGASGMLGAAAVAKAPGDGYTLLLGSAGETAINPLVYKARMQYQPQKDLAPITLVTRVPNVLVASPGFPAKNVAELVSYAKANPGKVGYATSGVGNPQHLNGELLASVAGIRRPTRARRFDRTAAMAVAIASCSWMSILVTTVALQSIRSIPPFPRAGRAIPISTMTIGCGAAISSPSNGRSPTARASRGTAKRTPASCPLSATAS